MGYILCSVSGFFDMSYLYLCTIKVWCIAFPISELERMYIEMIPLYDTGIVTWWGTAGDE